MYGIDLASEEGGSYWLNAMSLKKYNFNLTKSGF